MIDEKNLAEQIKQNCNISDANYWGFFSMCNLLLRLRDLYCHEHALNPWDSLQRENVSAWIADRESLWETLEGSSLNRIRIGTGEYDPFQIEEINSVLSENNLVYGAGYGLLKKPTFFLGRAEAVDNRQFNKVWIIQEELSRDLAPPFAMSQGNQIFIRMKILSAYLFQKFLDIGSRGPEDFIRLAYDSVGLRPGENSENLTQKIENTAKDVSEILIWHETGEIEERRAGNPWNDLIAESPDRLTEFRLRSIKDVLADTSRAGTLSHILERSNPALLYFYAGLMNETGKSFFPDLVQSMKDFIRNQDWETIRNASATARQKALLLTDKILNLRAENPGFQPIKDLLSGLASDPSPEKRETGRPSCSTGSAT